MKITGELHPNELEYYLRWVKKNRPGKELVGIVVDGIDVILDLKPIPFEKIRRITGYLVGTVDRWGDAKKAELEDRVKHSLSGGIENWKD